MVDRLRLAIESEKELGFWRRAGLGEALLSAIAASSQDYGGNQTIVKRDRFAGERVGSGLRQLDLGGTTRHGDHKIGLAIYQLCAAARHAGRNQ